MRRTLARYAALGHAVTIVYSRAASEASEGSRWTKRRGFVPPNAKPLPIIGATPRLLWQIDGAH